MMEPSRLLITLAGLLGAVAVAMGAYAAHGMAETFGPEAAHRAALGAQYQLPHAVALFVSGFVAPGLARGRVALAAGVLFTLGAILFPGALYLLAFGGPGILGIIAPIGGLCLIAGWLMLAIAGLGGRHAAPKGKGDQFPH
ncbi:DUF423 domain-containing protein [Marivibrio halodurans]|uniref:DUF423 domain-containing protein n=1 Tax=Marivibrio halodurans TaxID=2039722 RepID=A0A8J7S8W9_9PROT|nr:DUF423 domain-containing protein [Marivibrio halodurans]MBP5857572.1 DUF423 domain-containing protein [Marivibrio halodurans]